MNFSLLQLQQHDAAKAKDRPDALWWLWRQAGQGRRVGRICLSEAIRLRKGMKWNRKSIYGRRSAAGSRAEKTTWRLNPTAGMIALLACQFGIRYASVSALTMFDLIQFSLYRPSSQQELPQGALYCKPKTLKSSEREPLDQVQNVAASCFLQLSDIYNLTLTSLSPKSHKTMAKKQWIVSDTKPENKHFCTILSKIVIWNPLWTSCTYLYIYLHH